MAKTSRLHKCLFKIPFLLCAICVLYFIYHTRDEFRTKFVPRRSKFRLFNASSLNGTCTYYPAIESLKSRRNTTIHSQAIKLVMLYTHVQDHFGMKEKLHRCLSSLLAHTSAAIHLMLITDDDSLLSAREVLTDVCMKFQAELQVEFYHVDSIVEPLQNLVSDMQPHFSSKTGTYYSDAIFFLSIGIHKVFPQNQLIMTDIDIKFESDIKELHYYFQKFQKNAVIGIAQEQQPVYRHLLHDFRKKHPSTRAGSQPPNGLPGFNSGVLLLDLNRMRKSVVYNMLLNSTVVDNLTKKYNYKGHLGDQDFFSLISFEHEELFHILPCTWNRQLCQWWKHHGYSDVFESYNNCIGKVNIYHGNCNAYFPQ